MAIAYRDYLIKTGAIEALNTEKAGKDIPMYIEALGALDVQDTLLTFPVMVSTPLTTFEDLKTIYGELSSEGVKNLNFKLTGFTNGGLSHTVPYHVEFVKKIGGDKGFKDFVSFANENGIGVYPDFDFAYIDDVENFDGVSLRKDAAKTIDNRYISKYEYDFVAQSYMTIGLMVISPARYENIYNNFKKEYSALGGTGISVSTLGTDLNSDFNKKDPYNREEAKGFVTNILADMQENIGNVMIDGGNSYTLGYADHVLNVSLDSSGYTYAAGTIPFFGIVFHGYLDFAGSPTNMAGNYDHELLKIIENGASPYFLLAYQNTEKLKENYTYQQKYYSVSYEIWKEDIVESYAMLSEALGDLRTETIVNHEFVVGERIATEEDLAADKLIDDAAAAEKEKKDAEKLAEVERLVNYEKRMAEKEGNTEFDAEKYREQLMSKYFNPLEGVEFIDNFVLDPTQAVTDPGGRLVVQRPDLVIDIPEGAKLANRYTVDDNSIVKVTYTNGTVFYINYNDFAVTADGHEIEAFGFIKI